jgi:hypothetical protein
MTGRHRLTAGFVVPRDAVETWTLFTPSGERLWAVGWDPSFPVDGETDHEPGTVFVTPHNQDAATTWVVAGAEPGRDISYARVTPGVLAGTVTVRCEEQAPDSTRVEVTYDLTALSEAGAEQLTAFAAGYGDYIRGWSAEIARAIGE